MLIEDLISQDYTLDIIGTGRYFRCREHDSLIVDTEKQIFHWNSKSITGDIYTWLVKIRGMSPRDAFSLYDKEKGTDKKAGLEIETFVNNDKSPSVVVDPDLVNKFHLYGKNHLEYWKDFRGYTVDTIGKFKLGYSGEYYTIPITENGSFTNFQCRSLSPKRVKLWYRGVGPHIFNFEILKFSNWVVVTEGPVDAIMLSQYNIPAISQTGGAGNYKIYAEYFTHLVGLKKVFITYDNDKAGNVGSVKLADVLGSKALIYNFWDYKDNFDVSDYFKTGAGKDDFMELLEKKATRKEYVKVE